MSYLNSVNLTEKIIAEAEYYETPAYHDQKMILWDRHLPGFGLRVYPRTGKKAFCLKYRFNGVQTYRTLGYLDVLTLDGARERAIKIFKLVDDGIDPRVTTKKRRGK